MPKITSYRSCARAELLAAEQLASAKREKSIQAITDRSAYEVKKALSVAATLKENKQQAIESAAEALTMRLEAAEARRLAAMSTKSPEKRLGQPSLHLRALQP